MADTKIIQPEKKEKKKDKKKKKGTDVSESEDREKFKPVANPDFNPKLIAPFSPSKQEQWTMSSNKTIPAVTQKIEQQITPSERQGYTAETYYPRDNYSHLDPTKSTNAYSAFNELQQKYAPPLHSNNNQPQQYHSKQPQQAQQQQQRRQQQPQPQHINPMNNYPPMNHQRPHVHTNQPMNNQRPQQQQQRPTHLKDGVQIVSYARASWSYNAQISSELSFNANDTFAVIKQQPDGWWYAELLDPKRRKRGLVPGNYMIPY